ncbi:cytochrome P450 [Dietzia lutea]|nr:cytochrome P450 [Dietzia lutea]
MPQALTLPLEVGECPVGGSREMLALQSRTPVARAAMPDGQPVWLVTGYDEVRAVLGDRRFSSVSSKPGYPTAGGFGLAGSVLNRTMQRHDPPEHTRMRRMIAREFTPARVAGFQPIIDKAVEDVLKEVCASGEDVIEFKKQIAEEVPARVTDEIMGIPEDERAFFKEAAAALFNVHDSAEQYLESETRVADYIRSLITTGRATPDGLVSRLAKNYSGSEHASEDELAAYIMHLVVAGHETTTNQMTLDMWSLLNTEPPEGRSLDSLTRAEWLDVIDELMRFHAIVRGGPRRVAVEDITVGDVTIKAGEGVLTSIWTANHDPSAFDDPESWSWSRDERQPEHLGFGHGLHQCLGQYLAREELATVFTEFFGRFPAATLSEGEGAAVFGSDSTNYGMHSLRVQLNRSKRNEDSQEHGH